jgi:hypothetical protein
LTEAQHRKIASLYVKISDRSFNPAIAGSDQQIHAVVPFTALAELKMTEKCLTLGIYSETSVCATAEY